MKAKKSKKELLKEFELLKKLTDINKQEKVIKEAKNACNELIDKINSTPNNREPHKLLLLSMYNTSQKTINKSVSILNESIDEYREKLREYKKNKNKKVAAQKSPRKSLEELRTLVTKLPILLDEKKKELRKLNNTLVKLQEQVPYLDPQGSPTFLTRIEKLKKLILKHEQDFQKSEVNLNVARKLLWKNEPPQQIQSPAPIQNLPSKIPKILNNSRDIDRSSIAQLSLVESVAKNSIQNLLILRQNHLEEIAINKEKIEDYEDQLKDSLDPAAIPDELLQQEIDYERQSLQINSAKLQKVNENLMQLCMMILFRNRNLHYTERFKTQLKNILVQLNKSGFKLSKIALSKRRPVMIGSIKRPAPRLTKKIYVRKMADAMKRMDKALHLDSQMDKSKHHLPLGPRKKWDIKKELEDAFYAKLKDAKTHKRNLQQSVEDADGHLYEMNHFSQKGQGDAFDKSHLKYQNAVARILTVQKMLDEDYTTLIDMKRKMIPLLSSASIPEDLFTISKDLIPLQLRSYAMEDENDLENYLDEAMTRWRSVQHLAVNDPRFVRELKEALELNGKFYEFLIHKVSGEKLPDGFF